jgi:hypothetical protein
MRSTLAALLATSFVPFVASAGGSLRAEVVDGDGRSTRLVLSSLRIESAADPRSYTAVIELEDGSAFRDSLLSGEPIDLFVDDFGAPLELERCFVKSWSTSGDADDRPTQMVTLVFAGAPGL